MVSVECKVSDACVIKIQSVCLYLQRPQHVRLAWLVEFDIKLYLYLVCSMRFYGNSVIRNAKRFDWLYIFVCMCVTIRGNV